MACLLTLAWLCAAPFCGLSAAAYAAPASAPSTNGKNTAPDERNTRTHEELIVDCSRRQYTVNVGGYLDEDNTFTYTGYRGKPIHLFEPNISLTIENVGVNSVVNPRIVIDGRRDWGSMDRIVSAIERDYGPLKSDREKALAVWKFFVDHVYDSRGAAASYDGDPVVQLNCYGFAGCFDYAVQIYRVLQHMGFKRLRLENIGGTAHWIPEVYYAGDYHLLDANLATFFLKRDNRTIASIDDLANDIGLVRRTLHHNGPAGRDDFRGPWYESQLLAHQYANEPQAAVPPHRMDITLRPHESLIWRWRTIGKYAMHRFDLRPGRFQSTLKPSNGELVYAPDLERQANSAFGQTENIAFGPEGRLSPAVHPRQPGVPAVAICEMASPYPIVGGRIEMKLFRKSPTDVLSVSISTDPDHRRWQSCYRAKKTGPFSQSLVIDPFIHRIQSPPIYSCLIRFEMTAAANASDVGIDQVQYHMDLQMATYSLPALFLGTNRVLYTDETKGPHRVKITHRWHEATFARPPYPPALIAPANGARLSGEPVVFQWSSGGDPRDKAIADYHIEVSRYPDMRWAFAPDFDRFISKTRFAGQSKWQARQQGFFNANETYYWRVRSKNADGVWSGWSPVWSFALSHSAGH